MMARGTTVAQRHPPVFFGSWCARRLNYRRSGGSDIRRRCGAMAWTRYYGDKSTSQLVPVRKLDKHCRGSREVTQPRVTTADGVVFVWHKHTSSLNRRQKAVIGQDRDRRLPGIYLPSNTRVRSPCGGVVCWLINTGVSCKRTVWCLWLPLT